MASEISVSASLSFSVAGVSFSKSQSASQDKSTGTYIQGTVATGTANAPAASITATTPGYMLFKNLSTTVGEIIYLQTASGATTAANGMIARLPINGGIALIHLFDPATTILYHRSAAGTPTLEYSSLTTP